ncbi:MAG: OmpA family protein [Flavipsychrobacter sp.]|nr:OmpA family protein [Flavipsychrobacter sp.]
MKYLLLLLLCLTGTLTATAQADTFSVYFSLGAAEVTSSSKQVIRQLIKEHKLVHGQRIYVLGYADQLGDDSTNQVLSQRRAEGVKACLAAQGLQKEDIRVCAGRGAIVRSEQAKEGSAADRKVLIIAYKPGTVFPDYSSLFRVDTLKVNDIVTLDHVHFEMGKTLIWPDRTLPEAAASYDELDKVVEFLKEYSMVTVRIEGHVCCPLPGNDSTEVLRMSAERAYYVMGYLASHGVDRKRLSAVGYGTSRPFVHPERTPADEALNRRVAVRLLSLW